MLCHHGTSLSNKTEGGTVVSTTVRHGMHVFSGCDNVQLGIELWISHPLTQLYVRKPLLAALFEAVSRIIQSYSHYRCAGMIWIALTKLAHTFIISVAIGL